MHLHQDSPKQAEFIKEEKTELLHTQQNPPLAMFNQVNENIWLGEVELEPGHRLQA